MCIRDSGRSIRFGAGRSDFEIAEIDVRCIDSEKVRACRLEDTVHAQYDQLLASVSRLHGSYDSPCRGLFLLSTGLEYCWLLPIANVEVYSS